MLFSLSVDGVIIKTFFYYCCFSSFHLSFKTSSSYFFIFFSLLLQKTWIHDPLLITNTSTNSFKLKGQFVPKRKMHIFSLFIHIDHFDHFELLSFGDISHLSDICAMCCGAQMVNGPCFEQYYFRTTVFSYIISYIISHITTQLGVCSVCTHGWEANFKTSLTDQLRRTPLKCFGPVLSWASCSCVDECFLQCCVVQVKEGRLYSSNQLTPRQFRWIKSITGMKHSMYFWFWSELSI